VNAAAAAVVPAVQVRAPASLQGSSNFSSWGSFNSPLLLQQPQQTPFGGGIQPFESAPAVAAAAAGMPAAFRSLEPALTNYSTSSLTNSSSITPAPAPALNDLALFCSPAMSQAMLASSFDASAAASGQLFPASTGAMLLLASIGDAMPLTPSAIGGLGHLDYAGQSDVSLMDWLMLQQQLQQQEAAGIAAAAAAAPVEQPWMSGVGMAVPHADPVPAMLHNEASLSPPPLGSPVMRLAHVAAAPGPLPPPAPPPVAAALAAPAGADTGLAEALLNSAQQRRALARAQAPPSQPQPQQLMTVELEPQAWASIAENGGWQDIARLSGAQIEVQVQASSRLLALQISGSAAQVDMVSRLMYMLLQQPAMAARGVSMRA
jgi:hypothetical protein